MNKRSIVHVCLAKEVDQIDCGAVVIWLILLQITI